MNFTKEEINLCKQVTEKHRKKIEEGDWYLPHNDDIEPELYIAGITDDKANIVGIPLWTISDCLEFLKERSWTNYQFSFDKKGITEVHIVQTPFNFRSNQEIVERGTFLEVLLKAVLAVLEEGKDV